MEHLPLDRPGGADDGRRRDREREDGHPRLAQPVAADGGAELRKPPQQVGVGEGHRARTAPPPEDQPQHADEDEDAGGGRQQDAGLSQLHDVTARRAASAASTTLASAGPNSPG